MPLTPEQRAAWEREKAQREERERLAKDREALREDEARQIDEAIEKVGKMEKRYKALLAAGVMLYFLAVVLFFLFRR